MAAASFGTHHFLNGRLRSKVCGGEDTECARDLALTLCRAVGRVQILEGSSRLKPPAEPSFRVTVLAYAEGALIHGKE